MKGERVIKGLETQRNIKGMYIGGASPRRFQSGGETTKGDTLFH
jgi:hypothetical protein